MNCYICKKDDWFFVNCKGCLGDSTRKDKVKICTECYQTHLYCPDHQWIEQTLQLFPKFRLFSS